MKPQSLPPSAIRKGGLLSLGSKIFFLPLFNIKPFYFQVNVLMNVREECCLRSNSSLFKK
jgi:hypothetical protein